ncbi:MAG: PIG-L family deacetylase [Nocardioides sp.]
MVVQLEPGSSPTTSLPTWTSALAVVAHPDDESFALGAVLDALVRSGCEVSVLCLTRGEASTVHGISGDLRALRAMELQDAASALGVRAAELSDYPDGSLGRISRSALVREVTEAARRAEARGLVVFDPSGVTGHPDHVAASEAAIAAASDLDVPVLGWTIPSSLAQQLNEEFGTAFTGHEPDEVELTVPVVRDRQRVASLAHASQAVPTSVLWRRLELLGDVEHLRWLTIRHAGGTAATS